MTENFTSPSKPRRPLAARRLVLLGSVAAIGGAVLFGGHYAPQGNLPAISSAQAQSQVAMRPASFADIVEKVKPAVFAVRVKVEKGAEGMAFGDDETQPFPPGSQMERFFKRFGFGDMPATCRAGARAAVSRVSSAWRRAPASLSPPTVMR